jgi:hypothetical protein
MKIEALGGLITEEEKKTTTKCGGECFSFKNRNRAHRLGRKFL